MWDEIIGGSRFDFLTSKMHGYNSNKGFVKWNPTLVVLDDVSQIDHLKKLLYEGKMLQNTQKLITTRNTIVVKSGYRYDLQCLREPDAVSLLCYSTFY
jgi:hypothetical protein